MNMRARYITTREHFKRLLLADTPFPVAVSYKEPEIDNSIFISILFTLDQLGSQLIGALGTST